MNSSDYSVAEARAAIINFIKRSPIVLCDLKSAQGCIIAKDLKSPINSPPFDQSAMDGYAIRYADLALKKLKVTGESTAGKVFDKSLKRGEAVRIFTGGKIPDGADTVIIQEKVTREKNEININDPDLKKGSNIRYKGSQISRSAIAVPSGTLLNAGTMGFIASLGIDKIKIFRKPLVGIIVTGSELKKAGSEIKDSEIYESNSMSLVAALESNGIFTPQLFFVKDNLLNLAGILKKAITKCDAVILTGGISAGDYDFTAEALEINKVKKVFYKVKQKPGKPLYFGMKNSKPVFALPGNPAAVLTCYYNYVLPALRIAMGDRNPFLKELQLPASHSYNKKPGLTHFLKAITDFKSVSILDGQESYKMQSFMQANCLVEISENVTVIKKGDFVKLHLLQRFI